MQHFDGTRGTHICLVDSLGSSLPARQKHQRQQQQQPEAAASSSLGSKNAAINDSNAAQGGAETNTILDDPLWKRLLFGDVPEEDDLLEASDRSGGGDRNCSDSGGVGSAAKGSAKGQGFRAAKVGKERRERREGDW